jgi:aspartate aminotransferase-like enzyme
MLIKSRLFTPGPTPLLPSAQLAMAAADIHHRTADFRTLYSRVLADVQTFIGTNNDVIMFASSGTGAMEAAVSNLTSPGDKVLVVTAGKFGERWKGIASAYGCNVEVVAAPYGQTINLDEVKAKLTPDVRVLYTQATESSTGVRHDIEGIAKLTKNTETLLVVDAITGLGTTHFDVDGWGIDFIIGGSQKAVMIPPGLAYCAVSERAWKRMETTKNPRFYFDLRKERKNAAKGESSYTPAIALIAALGSAFDFIRNMGHGDLAAGRVALVNNAEMCAEMMREAALALKLKLFAPTAPSAAVTSIYPPAGVDSGAIVKGFRQEFGAVISNGQGEMKGEIFRMAHLGYFDYMDTIATIGALEQVLGFISLPKHVEFGQGLKAAQEVYARVAGSARSAAKTGA